jgi:hypothetical protein
MPAATKAAKRKVAIPSNQAPKTAARFPPRDWSTELCIHDRNTRIPEPDASAGVAPSVVSARDG